MEASVAEIFIFYNGKGPGLTIIAENLDEAAYRFAAALRTNPDKETKVKHIKGVPYVIETFPDPKPDADPKKKKKVTVKWFPRLKAENHR